MSALEDLDRARGNPRLSQEKESEPKMRRPFRGPATFEHTQATRFAQQRHSASVREPKGRGHHLMSLPPSLAPLVPPPISRCDPRLDDSQADDWIQLPAATRQSLGVGLAALSALISTFALLIMKHSADVEKGLMLWPSCKHPWRKRWWIGFIMNTGSELGISTFALMFVPMTVIAPVNGSAVIFSALVARLGWVSDRIYRITQARSCSDASLLSAATASSLPPCPLPASSSPPPGAGRDTSRHF